MSLTPRETSALNAAHRILGDMLPLDEDNFHGMSYSRVAAALFGRCSGMEAGAFGDPDVARRKELGDLVTEHIDEGSLRTTLIEVSGHG